MYLINTVDCVPNTSHTKVTDKIRGWSDTGENAPTYTKSAYLSSEQIILKNRIFQSYTFKKIHFLLFFKKCLKRVSHWTVLGLFNSSSQRAAIYPRITNYLYSEFTALKSI
jgi:hypothetical protein